MTKDPWLPIGYKMPDGAEILRILEGGNSWQIFASNQDANFLIASRTLAEKWSKEGIIESTLFQDFEFGGNDYCILKSPSKHELRSILDSNPIVEKVDALAFALTINETRKRISNVSLHDAIYVEQHSRLLPTWTLSPSVPDEVILGSQITGGVPVSVKSSRRLSSLAYWFSAEDLEELIEASGVANSSICETGKLEKKSGKAETSTVTRSRPSSDKKKFSLAGRFALEQFLNEHVVDIILNAEKYRKLGVNFPAGIILHGPPGCGKTFAVERLVEFIDWPNYTIDSNSIGSPYIHATSKKISEVFDKAIKESPSIIVIDEMESFLSNRSGGASGRHQVEEVAEFLRRIPEAIESQVLIIGMTNLIDMIDPAILRRGRFDHVIQVDMPSEAEVYNLTETLLENLPTSENVNVGILAKSLRGRALSDAAFIVREAARIAARNNQVMLDHQCLESALKLLPDLNRNHSKIGFHGTE